MPRGRPKKLKVEISKVVDIASADPGVSGVVDPQVLQENPELDRRVQVGSPIQEIQFAGVEFEGSKVVKLLNYGHRLIGTQYFYHCQMSDGTTKHVPADKFHDK